MVSKALILAAYRRKLTELARLGVDVVAVVPPAWREGGGTMSLESEASEEYELVVTAIRWNGHFHLHYYPELPSLVDRFRPDIVHLDEEPYNLSTYLGVRAASRRQTHSLFFTWQNIARKYPLPFRVMERNVYHTVSAGLAGTEAAADVLRQKGFSRPVSVVPQFGVDQDLFQPRAPGGAGSTFRIGFLNRLIPAKAPLLALQALQRLPPDSHLSYVGSGPLQAAIEAEIATRTLASRVTMRGRVASRDMPGVLRDLDAVVLPSLTTHKWKEQFGRVLIEAMACGIPVVGSDSGEIPAVVGDAGLIVPEGSAAELAAALSRLRLDPGLRADLGRKGRQRVLEHFTHARIAEQTVQAYEGLE